MSSFLGRVLLLGVCAVAFGPGGCGEKPQPRAPVQVSAPTSPADAGAAPAISAAEATQLPPPVAGEPPDSKRIYYATRRFLTEKGRQATSVEELVANNYLPPLPPPPPGKKYLLDQRAAELRVVDK